MSKNLLRNVYCLALAAVFALSGTSFADDSFEFHGYMRSGFAVNETLAGSKGSMSVAPTKYRLGNEANNTYIENCFVKNWTDDDGQFMKFVFRGAWSTQERQNWASEGDTGVVREAYVQGGGFDFGPKGMKAWAGDRFYAREDIHITDFYYRDLSGYGFGLEEINIGFSKLNFAWIANSDGGTDAVNSDGDTIGKRIAHNFDLQFNEIKLPGGALNVELDTIYLVGGVDEDTGANESNKIGYFTEVSYNLASFLGFGNGFFKIVGQYGLGAGGNEWGFANASGALWSGGEATLDDFVHYRTLLWGVWDISANTSILPMFVYDFFDNDAGNEKTWISAGFRLKQHFTRNFALNVEVGYDSYDQKATDTTQTLTKITVAPTFTFDTGFWTRPEIRLYATYGMWNSDAEGNVGAAIKADDSSAMQFGAQAEAWW